MEKWFGKIGFSEMYQATPGEWRSQIVEHNYYGDLIRNASSWSTTPDSTNDDLRISNRLCIVADPYAAQNFHSMKYVEYMGVKWKIISVEVQRPSLILSIGGVYNGQEN